MWTIYWTQKNALNDNGEHKKSEKRKAKSGFDDRVDDGIELNWIPIVENEEGGKCSCVQVGLMKPRSWTKANLLKMGLLAQLWRKQ